MVQFSKSFWRQSLNIFPVASTNFLLGAGLGWVAPALVHFASGECEFPVTKEDISWIASTYFALEVSTPIVAGVLSNKIGRKPLLILSSLFVLLSWVAIIFANSANLLIFARVVLGISAGIQDITWSIYLGEVAKPTERGVFGSIMVSIIIFGLIFEFFLSLFVPYLYLAIIPLFMSVPGFIGSFFIIESPQLLLMHNKDDEAMRNLAWLRGIENEHVAEEFNEIKNNIEEEKNTNRSIKHFFRHTSEYKVYIMVVVVFGLYQLSGNMVILSYEGLIMRQYDDIPSGHSLPFIYGLMQFIFANVAPFLIETAGRRILLLSGFAISFVIQTTVSFLFYVDQHKILPIPHIPWIILVLFNLYGIVFVVFLLPTAYVIKSELFPQELKSIGSVCATFFSAISQFLILKFFINIWMSLGLWANFALYAGICLFTVVYIYSLIPETKGQSLVQIQKNIVAANNDRKSKNLKQKY